MAEIKKPGFHETPEPYRTSVRVTVGPDGRILIPAALRRQAGLEPGATVVVDVKDGELVLATLASRIRKLQDIASRYKRPGVSVVDEFLAERRAMWGDA